MTNCLSISSIVEDQKIKITPKMFSLIVFLIAIKFAQISGEISQNYNKSEITENSVKNSNFKFDECRSELIKIIDKIDKKYGEISLYNGVSIVKNSDGRDFYTKLYGSSDKFADCSDYSFNKQVLAKIVSFINSRSLVFKLNPHVWQNETDDARGSKLGGGKKGTEMLLAAAAMMKGMLATMMMGALAGLAGKALLTGLMALTLSAIVGLKSLASSGHKKTTYEIVAKPVYAHSHSHSSSHESNHGGHGGGSLYGRSDVF